MDTVVIKFGEIVCARFNADDVPPANVLSTPESRYFEERLETERILLGKTWRELKGDDIIRIAIGEGIAHLDAEALIYYLPAFLVWTAKRGDRYGQVVDALAAEMAAAADSRPLFGVRWNSNLTEWLKVNQDIARMWAGIIDPDDDIPDLNFLRKQ